MRKKLLVLFVLLGLFSLNSIAQISSISGNQSVITGELWMYSLYFNTPLATDTEFIINTSKYGVFNNSQDSIRPELIKKGTTRYDFFIQWGTVPTNEATISAYKRGDLPSNVKKLKVKVLKSDMPEPEPEPDPNPNVDARINGPKTVYVGDEIEFYYNGSWFNDLNYYLYISWIYDKNIFDLVRYTDLNRCESYSVRLKVKEISQESLVTNIKTNVLEKFLGEYSDLEGGNISVTVKYKPTKLAIKSNDSFVCNNSLVTYSLEGIASFVKNYTISWQSTSSMTLVSGQGTTTATYRASGNGYGTVKATVTFDGKDYTVENSDVWVGPPPRPKIEGLLIGDYKPNTDYLLVSEYYKYTGSFNWRVVGGATLIPGADGVYSQMILRTDNLLPNKTTSFSIYLTAQNRCGTSPQLIENGYVVAGRFPDPGGFGRAGDPKFGLQSATAIAPVTVKVYTFNTGTLVYSEKNVIDFNIQNTTLKDGIYVVFTTDQNGETKSEKVIKTRN